MKPRKSEKSYLLAAVVFLAFASPSHARGSESPASESASSRRITLWMQWQRGNNSHYGSNFVYLHTSCQNGEPCECGMSFKATNSREFADYISSFGGNMVPVVYDVVYGADGRAKTNQLISVGTWESDRFPHNDRLISVSAKFQGGGIGEHQSFRLHGSEDCFPSSDGSNANPPSVTSLQSPEVTGNSTAPQQKREKQEQSDRVSIPSRDAEGLLIKKEQPVYPQGALEHRIQGTVIFNVQISENGNVTGVRLISGHPQLVSAATEAVKQWIYKPYLINGRAVAVEAQVQVDFRLPTK
jgi:TonB family protein